MFLGALAALAVIALVGSRALAAQPVAGSRAASDAVSLCERADALEGDERSELLERGIARAEEAIAAVAADPVAHFALFCTLGKRLQARRVLLFSALVEVSRLEDEIDLALRLAPDYAAALAAKGQMLIELPRILGGDPAVGRCLLSRAVAADPTDLRLRAMLAAADGTAGKEAALR